MAYTTINKPSNYFDTKLYAGNSSTQTVTGVNFKPDLVWIKNRGVAGTWHNIIDSVRGTSKTLYANTNNADGTDNYLSSFNSNGFSLNTGDSGSNTSGNNYVSWNWLASGTTAVSNTAGTISSTVSANTTSGFSIVSWTGNFTGSATIGHGLGVTPKLVIIKNRSTLESWQVWFNNNTRLQLNTTAVSLGTYPISTNSTLITLPSTPDGAWNGSGNSMIAYCFADVKGFSKFGSYTGNSSTNGTFVYTGFKPAWVTVKNITEVDGWINVDNKRDTINVASRYILQHSTDAEASGNICDFLSNGFKLREGFHGTNTSGQTYIYMAFAEQPLVGTNNVPATAR